jgi:POT family proton-dependent oligopeptide transporter
MGLLALGMACVAFGASGIEVQNCFCKYDLLILVYLFHTMAELCILSWIVLCE